MTYLVKVMYPYDLKGLELNERKPPSESSWGGEENSDVVPGDTHAHAHTHTRTHTYFPASRIGCHWIRGFCSFSLTLHCDPVRLSRRSDSFIRLLQSVATHPCRGGVISQPFTNHTPAHEQPDPRHQQLAGESTHSLSNHLKVCFLPPAQNLFCRRI